MSFGIGVQGKAAEGSATEIPWDPEHVNIGNECDKILLHSAETDGIPGILKVRYSKCAQVAHLLRQINLAMRLGPEILVCHSSRDSQKDSMAMRPGIRSMLHTKVAQAA